MIYDVTSKYYARKLERPSREEDARAAIDPPSRAARLCPGEAAADDETEAVRRPASNTLFDPKLVASLATRTDVYEKNALVRVMVDDCFGGQPNDCHNNVASVLASCSTGEYVGVFGWMLDHKHAKDDNEFWVVLEHSILQRKSDGSLLDPTPHPCGEVLFLRDPLISFETYRRVTGSTSMIKTVYPHLPIDMLAACGKLKYTSVLPFGIPSRVGGQETAADPVAIDKGEFARRYNEELPLMIRMGCLRLFIFPDQLGVDREVAAAFGDYFEKRTSLHQTNACIMCGAECNCRCKQCTLKLYCSKACCNLDRKRHKKECVACGKAFHNYERVVRAKGLSFDS